MFDPFDDFATAGYLRNKFAEKDPEIVSVMEHEMFRAGLDAALALISRRRQISYQDFLQIHSILFGEFYPWAGQDRRTTTPRLAVSKAEVMFADPRHCHLAVEQGLRLGQRPDKMRAHFGEVMGLFAFGHPFLDGNGRTMLVVHAELCDRAGFAIAWERTDKADYLRALSAEIESPGKGILEEYLAPFVTAPLGRDRWSVAIGDLRGLDGTMAQDTIEGDVGDPQVSQKYRAFDLRRGYVAR